MRLIAVLILSILLCLPPAHSLSVRQRTMIQALSATTCTEAGYVSGCCIPGNTNCFVDAAKCYCDITCHMAGDCCTDIEDIGCFAPGATLPPAPSSTISPITTESSTTDDNCPCAGSTTCTSEGMSPGCCKASPLLSCYVPGGRCHCDSPCHLYGDCCEDVSLAPTCTN